MTDTFEPIEPTEQPQVEPGENPSRAELADPVTVRNNDPAAMSEAERNRRLTEQYNA